MTQENKQLCATEDRIIVRKKKERMSEGGIAIPEVASSKQAIGEVIAIGPKAEGVDIGDEVLFTRAGIKIMWKNEELVVLRCGEIIAKLV
jgi:co-chaperonin GroES (HSP10)